MIEIIEQNLFDRVGLSPDLLLRSNFLFPSIQLFSADDFTHIKSGNPIQNTKSTKVLFFVHHLNEPEQDIISWHEETLYTF